MAKGDTVRDPDTGEAFVVAWSGETDSPEPAVTPQSGKAVRVPGYQPPRPVENLYPFPGGLSWPYTRSSRR